MNGGGLTRLFTFIREESDWQVIFFFFFFFFFLSEYATSALWEVKQRMLSGSGEAVGRDKSREPVRVDSVDKHREDRKSNRCLCSRRDRQFRNKIKRLGSFGHRFRSSWLPVTAESPLWISRSSWILAMVFLLQSFGPWFVFDAICLTVLARNVAARECATVEGNCGRSTFWNREGSFGLLTHFLTHFRFCNRNERGDRKTRHVTRWDTRTVF